MYFNSEKHTTVLPLVYKQHTTSVNVKYMV